MKRIRLYISKIRNHYYAKIPDVIASKNKLSGGERQRLGIARALYREPEILIMDEATSSLDNFTEQQVMNSIQKLKNKHTIVMIAHRLSTIKACDRIYLIEEGKVKDAGLLSELLQRYPYLDNYNKSKF